MDRLKAAMIDGVILIIFMFLVGGLFSNFENIPNLFRIIAFVFIFLLYDPIFTSFFGGTIGHMILRIRVKREGDTKKNIPFLLAIIRFIVKALLGSISLLTVSGSEKGKAIHDKAAGSVVVYKG